MHGQVQFSRIMHNSAYSECTSTFTVILKAILKELKIIVISKIETHIYEEM